MRDADPNGGERLREEADARDRLALTRVLIWAEREATVLGRPEAAEALREALALLHAKR